LVRTDESIDHSVPKIKKLMTELAESGRVRNKGDQTKNKVVDSRHQVTQEVMVLLGVLCGCLQKITGKRRPGTRWQVCI
jgi:hypothetical protein